MLNLSSISECAGEELGSVNEDTALELYSSCGDVLTDPCLPSTGASLESPMMVRFFRLQFITSCRMELFQRKICCHSCMSLIELYGFARGITDYLLCSQ